MKFAVGLLQSRIGTEPDGLIFRQAIEQSRLAESLGFHSVWFTEQHSNSFGVCPDPLTFTAHLAGLTRRIRLGTSVVVLSLQNPVSIAERAAFVDQVSEGRLELGIGKGHPRQNYTPFGLKAEDNEARFLEAHELLRMAWSQEVFSFHGDYFDVDSARIVPRPFQSPHPPLWVASFGNPAMIRFAAQHGYPLLHTFTGDSLRQNLDLYRNEYKGTGAPRMNLVRMVYVQKDRQKAREAMRGPARWYIENNPGRPAQILSYDLAIEEFISKLGIIGSVKDCIDNIRELRDNHGIELLACIFGPGGVPHEEIMASMRLFSEKVMPEFAD